MICYVLPVLRMTSYLLKAEVARRRRPAEAQCTCSLGLGYKFTYSIAGIFTCRCPVPGTMGRVPDNLGHVTRIMSSASKSGTMLPYPASDSGVAQTIGTGTDGFLSTLANLLTSCSPSVELIFLLRSTATFNNKFDNEYKSNNNKTRMRVIAASP